MTVGILCEHPTPRFQYACELVFRVGMRLDYRLVTDASELADFAIRVAYTKANPDAQLWIQPHGLLSQTGTANLEPEVGEHGHLPTVFPNASDLGFDLFAATFFLATRYEEYANPVTDAMGRYVATASLAYRKGFLELPVIDLWVKHCFDRLVERTGVQLRWPHAYRLVATVDVDSAFAYRHKGAYRTLGGMAKDLVGGNFANLGKRIRCLLKRVDDPYDTFDWLHGVHAAAKVDATWFFLLADFARYDKPVPWRSKRLQEVIRHCAEKARVGIHPGVASVDDDRLLAVECARLASITGEPVVCSRQHYLAFRTPDSFRNLQALEVAEEHSMGFADRIGFRAGTSRSFPWYDLEAERMTALHIHPFAAMDATLNRYMQLTPDEALERLQQLSSSLRGCGGQLTLLWHNETVSETAEWKGWRRVYAEAVSNLS
jgi:hypothetical protein